MDLGFPIRHLEGQLKEFECDLYRLRLYRDDIWNNNIKQRILEYKEAIEILQQANGSQVGNRRELLCAFFEYFRDNGEANIGMSIEQFVDAFLSTQ